MTSITELPNELTECVASFLSPEDSLTLALTCKRVHAALKPTIAFHCRMFKKYGRFPSDDAIDVWQFTCDIVNDASRAKYIRHLDLKNVHRMYDPSIWPYDQWNANKMVPHAGVARDLLNAMHRPLPFATNLDAGSVSELCHHSHTSDEIESPLDIQVERGYADPVLALLVTVLPEVRTLQLDSSASMYTSWLQEAFFKITSAFTFPSKPPETLSKLSHFEMEHWDTQNGFEIDWIHFALAIPGIKSIKGVRAYRNYEHTEEKLEPVPSSLSPSLTKLQLELCNMTSEALAELLQRTPNLKQFIYSDGGNLIGDVFSHPRSIAEAVVEHLSGSLEECVIEYAEDGPCMGNEDFHDLPPPISFSHFTRLHSLTCILAVLADVDKVSTLQDDPEARARINEDPLGMVRRLPSTLQSLTLYPPEDGWDGAEDIIIELLKNKEKHLPQLHTLRLVHSLVMGKVETEGASFALCGLEELAQEVGVRGYWCRRMFPSLSEMEWI